MELVIRYSSLIKKLPGNNSNKDVIRLPLSLTVYKRAVNLKIPGELINSLHFIDLQILIFSMEIDNVKIHLEQMNRLRLQKKGIKEIRPATEQEFDRL